MILSAFSFRTLTLLFIKVYNTQLSFKCQSIFVLFSIQSNFSALLFDFSASPAYNRQRVIKMNWIHNHKRALLHINLAFIGGLTGVYAILVRSGNFGAAQTMNLIEMILNFAEMNLTDAFLRLAIFILYHCSFLNRGTFFLRKILYRAGDRNCLCMDCRNHSVIRSSIDRTVPCIHPECIPVADVYYSGML